MAGLSTLGTAADPAEAVRRRLAGGKSDIKGVVFKVSLLACLLISLLIIVVLLVDVIGDSAQVFGDRFADFMRGTLRSRSGDEALGIAQGIRGSIWIGLSVILLAFPLGIAAAIYLEEYAEDTRLTRFIQLNIRNLAGVPSVVYGLLGLTIFVKILDGFTSGGTTSGGRSLISAGLTLSVLVLPVVIITSSEAIRAVPQALREGGYGVGATKWEVIRSHVLPYAAPGILTGTLLSLARAIGEAAPLILVGAVTGRLGSNPGMWDVTELGERFTALPIIITSWVGDSGGGQDNAPEGLGFAAHAAAAIVVLMVLVMVLNSAAIVLRNRFEKKRG